MDIENHEPSADIPAYVFEHRRSLIALFAVAALVLAGLDRASILHREGYEELISASGWILVMAGIGIRFWGSLYIAGNRDRHLQSSGPYALVRNPLYLGNLFSGFGIGLLSESAVATLCLMLGLTFVFCETIKYEDRKLLRLFGSEFIDYRQRVPALWPRIGDIRRFALSTDSRKPVRYTNFGSELKSARGVLVAALLVYLYSTLLAQLAG